MPLRSADVLTLLDASSSLQSFFINPTCLQAQIWPKLQPKAKMQKWLPKGKNGFQKAEMGSKRQKWLPKSLKLHSTSKNGFQKAGNGLQRCQHDFQNTNPKFRTEAKKLPECQNGQELRLKLPKGFAETQNGFQKPETVPKTKIAAISRFQQEHSKISGPTYNLCKPTFAGKPTKCCAGAQGRKSLKV